MSRTYGGIPEIGSYDVDAIDWASFNKVGWQLAPERAGLLVHDMQRYFLRPLPPALREPLVRNAALVRDRCAEAGVPIAYTAQPGDMSDRDRGLLKDFWGPGMHAAPADRRIVDPLAPREGDRVFTKWRYSAFHRSDLLEFLRAAGRDQLILCGVYAHVGVQATAVEAFSHDIETFLVADAIADFSALQHRQTLEYVAQCCAVVITAKEAFA